MKNLSLSGDNNDPSERNYETPENLDRPKGIFETGPESYDENPKMNFIMDHFKAKEDTSVDEYQKLLTLIAIDNQMGTLSNEHSQLESRDSIEKNVVLT